MGLLIFIGLVSIFFSFLCSILEAVLLSITPTFINLKIKEGKVYAHQLEKLKNDVDRPLIAILTLNTVAHTVGAILVGVQAKAAYVDIYGSQEISFFGIAFTEEFMVGLVSTIMTILILVASEIIPKTIGATYWKKLANFTAKALTYLIFPLKITGILWLLQLTTKLIGGNSHEGSVLTREDFSAMAEMAQEEGVFQKSESRVIQNLINFKEVQAKDIMTPRTVIVMAQQDESISGFITNNPELKFSRIPIFDSNQDEITGYVLKTQMLEAMIKGNGEKPLKSIKRKLMVTTRIAAIPDLFEKLIAGKEHFALVVDEYGSVSGLVTQEDVIETLLGLEIMDESDHVADLQLLARKSWEKRAKGLGLIE